MAITHRRPGQVQTTREFQVSSGQPRNKGDRLRNARTLMENRRRVAWNIDASPINARNFSRMRFPGSLLPILPAASVSSKIFWKLAELQPGKLYSSVEFRKITFSKVIRRFVVGKFCFGLYKELNCLFETFNSSTTRGSFLLTLCWHDSNVSPLTFVCVGKECTSDKRTLCS